MTTFPPCHSAVPIAIGIPHPYPECFIETVLGTHGNMDWLKEVSAEGQLSHTVIQQETCSCLAQRFN